MLEENKKILENNYYLNKRKDARTRAKFTKVKNRTFLAGIFIAFLCIVFLYLNSFESKIFKVVVSGNYYLDAKEVIELSQLDEDDFYLFFSKGKVKRNLLKHPLIEEVNVRRSQNRYVEIEIKETALAAYFNENDQNYLLLLDGRFIEYENVPLNIPFIEGFTSDQLSNIASGFKDLSKDMLDEISEIHRYPFSYDENMMELIMRDGNYVFVSSFGLKMINQYHAVLSGLNNPKHSCIYLDEVTNSGYQSACPWQNTEEIIEEE